MSTDLIIIGAGGSSREIAGAVADVNRLQPRWNVRGFLDDDATKHGTLVDGLPVLGAIEAAVRYPEARFVIGIASYKNPATRRRIAASLQLPAERFATIVHPSASVSDHARLGPGTAVLHGVVITSATVIGHHVMISQGALLAHDVVVGDCVTIAPGAVISGSVQIEDSAYIGSCAVIAPGVRVGAEALVGLGAVVTGDVPAGCTVFGNPARAINASEGRLRRWTP